jgi:DNA polymerase-1
MLGVAARVYASDKAAAELCTRMSQRGFGYDTQRAKELRDVLFESEQRAILAADDAVGRKLNRTKTGGISTKDLQLAFFGDLRAPVYFRSELTRQPSLGVDAMRGYAACADDRLRALSLAILEFRRARKMRSTYIENVPLDADGRVHPSWQNYGAVSGRWSCADPNLMNLPRPGTDPTADTHDGGIRSLYRARHGYRLVSFDKKQLEMRIAAYASGDVAMIAACESIDLHSSNAIILFGDAFARLDPSRASDRTPHKQMRTAAKSAGFAVCYLAEAPTVFARIIADGLPITLPQVEAMLRRLRRGFGTYYAWQEKRLLDCIRLGFTDSPILGRQRWLGHEPAPTECANFPIQGGAADVMNALLPPLERLIVDECPGAGMVAQVHDSAVFEVRERDVDRCKMLCEEANAPGVAIGTSGAMLYPVLPIDLEDSERWH